MTSAAHRLQARELKKSFKTKTVVDGVSFDIRSGEVVGLLGPNGAGKTTSFYMVVGLLKPTQGHGAAAAAPHGPEARRHVAEQDDRAEDHRSHERVPHQRVFPGGQVACVLHDQKPGRHAA